MHALSNVSLTVGIAKSAEQFKFTKLKKGNYLDPFTLKQNSYRREHDYNGCRFSFGILAESVLRDDNKNTETIAPSGHQVYHKRQR